jgi:hypothetical protein
MRRLAVESECGPTTCWDPTTETWCRWARTSHFGTRCSCDIWCKELRDQHGVRSGPGMLQRLQECLVAEGRGEG